MKKTDPVVSLHEEGGQSPWLDFIHRGLLASGEFHRLVREGGVRGVTSNPTIFEKAMSTGKEYEVEIRRLAASGASPHDAYEEMAVEDIRNACEALAPLYDASGGTDGFVSLEVEPALAHDAAATAARAEELYGKVTRDNLMVKIPATKEGIAAIEEATAKGISINATLIFSVKAYEEVAKAYQRGLARFAAEGGNLRRVHSVASFFVSRVDTAVDALLEETARRWPQSPKAESCRSLEGKAAVANARLAYARFLDLFSTPEWKALEAKGGNVQRPLWASTGTKNPAYSDVKYVEELVGPRTVNTMPPQTMEAFRDHGKVRDCLTGREKEARAVLDGIGLLGISLEEVCDRLLADGVKSFADSFDSLVASVGKRLASAS
jgi:transaldolase/glucose-6-phosphate isomerase